MTALTTRDALTRALCREYHPMHWDVGYGNRSKPCEACRTHAARLLASGAVIDAATLADDEALVRKVATTHAERPFTTYPLPMAHNILHALAAALSERAR